jgi:hypothetical protein
MGQLTELHLAESRFQGYMPTTLSLLTKLTSINVEGNLFDFQSAPSWISNLTLLSSDFVYRGAIVHRDHPAHAGPSEAADLAGLVY